MDDWQEEEEGGEAGGLRSGDSLEQDGWWELMQPHHHPDGAQAFTLHR